MASLLIPDKVVLRIVDSGHKPLRVVNVLFFVHTFANRKNDFMLGPFATDADGVVTIMKRDLLAEASAHYDSGLMDYDVIENCQPIAEIAAMEPRAIEEALEARTNVGKRYCEESASDGQILKNFAISTAQQPTLAFRRRRSECGGMRPQTTLSTPLPLTFNNC